MFRFNFFVNFALGVLFLQELVKAEDIAVETRIVGGVSTSIQDNPYLMQIIIGSQFCGGSLIRPLWVLTAAHCVRNAQPSQVTVIGGTSTMLGNDGQRRGVVLIRRHADYNAQTNNKDVGLLKLRSAMTGSNINTIPLGGEVKNGWSVKLAGWGVTSEGGQVSTKVRSTRVTVVTNERCRTAYSRVVPITKDMFCAAATGKDSCSGDSGGPVIYNHKVFGIVSFGYGCARSGYPGVYTRVSEVTTWINNVIANNS